MEVSPVDIICEPGPGLSAHEKCQHSPIIHPSQCDELHTFYLITWTMIVSLYPLPLPSRKDNQSQDDLQKIRLAFGFIAWPKNAPKSVIPFLDG
jgi:hypothetical protein